MMKLKSIVLTLGMVIALAGCSAKQEVAVSDSVSIRVAALKGPSAMGMVKLMEEAEHEKTKQNAYEFLIAESPDEIVPLLVKGELDIATVPANLASVLYHTTGGQVKVMGINTLGVLYIVENGDAVNSVEDLRGKTIYLSGKEDTPEYVLNYILSENGLVVGEDVMVEFKSEHSEVVAALGADKEGVAMLPQPFVTTAIMNQDTIRIALDLTKEWDALQTGKEKSSLLTGVIIGRTSFLEEYKEHADLFMEQYEKSVQFVNDNVSDAATLIGLYDIVKASVAKEALPYCNITFIQGQDMKESLSGYLNVLYEQNRDSIGGVLPDEAFYYEK